MTSRAKSWRLAFAGRPRPPSPCLRPRSRGNISSATLSITASNADSRDGLLRRYFFMTSPFETKDAARIPMAWAQANARRFWTEILNGLELRLCFQYALERNAMRKKQRWALLAHK